MTHVINQGMAMYWGTSRWTAMEIMVSDTCVSDTHCTPEIGHECLWDRRRPVKWAKRSDKYSTKFTIMQMRRDFHLWQLIKSEAYILDDLIHRNDLLTVELLEWNTDFAPLCFSHLAVTCPRQRQIIHLETNIQTVETEYLKSVLQCK